MMVGSFTFCRLVSLLLPVLSFVRVESTLYYELVPYITLRAQGLGSKTLIGDFASYSDRTNTDKLPLVFVPDGFGCPRWNDTINFNWLYSQPIPTAMKTVLSSQVVKIPENGNAESHL